MPWSSAEESLTKSAYLRRRGSTSIYYTCHWPNDISFHFKCCWLDWEWEYLLPLAPTYFCAFAVARHLPLLPSRRTRANKARQGTGLGHKRASCSFFSKLRLFSTSLRIYLLPWRSEKAEKQREKFIRDRAVNESSPVCVWRRLPDRSCVFRRQTQSAYSNPSE